MAIQIVTDQIGAQQVDSSKIASSTITATQMAMNGTFNYTGALQSSSKAVATQEYVDNAIAGLHWKKSATCASTEDIALTYANGTAGVGATLTATANGVCQIDSITLNANDRVLIKDQSDGFECGIYYVSDAGSGSSPYVLTRGTDSDTPAELKSAAIFVERGTSQNIAFVQTADNVTHIVANQLIDRTGDLVHLSEDIGDDPLKRVLDRADEVTRPIPERKGPAQRTSGQHPRNVRVIPRSRDFH